MRLTFFKNTLLIWVLPLISCGSSGNKNEEPQQAIVVEDKITLPVQETAQLLTGAEQPKEYSYVLAGQRIAVVANQTSKLYNYANNSDKAAQYSGVHLVDFLKDFGANLTKVFAPEHGFRGAADAGESVQDDVDTKTGLPILSLHGKNKKPTQEQLADVDVVVFDIQDVGVRFYTYVSTMHYVMEACAEKGIPFVLLDRPNPNGHYIDGPIMEAEHTGFLGLHPIPLVHGMTLGEYAQMINGEGWLQGGVQCDLKVIRLRGYTHNTPYSLPDRPSPNLPNDQSIALYPSLGLLEGTTLNAGRGTEMQFQIFGSPLLPSSKYTFAYTPQPNFGSKYPKHKGTSCNGMDLREATVEAGIDLRWIIDAYRNFEDKSKFFNTKNFTAHAGTKKLQQQIEKGLSFEEIRQSWQQDLEAFDKIRSKYLLYQ